MSKKSEKLFGFSQDEYRFRNIILTPIDKLYSLFSDGFSETHAGWWKSGVIENSLIVKCPVGRHSEDVLYFAPQFDNMIFLGYCGSCNRTIGIGDIVCASSTEQSGKRITANYDFIPYLNMKKGTFSSVSTLHEQEDGEFLKSMQTNKIDCIDMESHYLFGIARQKNVNFGGLFIVSDNLVIKPFYMVDNKDIFAIKSASDSLREIVLKEIYRD